MKLTEIYRQILKALHITAGPEGLLSYEAIDSVEPIIIKDDGKNKRLVLPTRDVLDNCDWDNYIAFHPLSEHLNRGVSPVMNTLVKTATLRLTEVLSSLLEQLVELAADKSRHASMGPKAQKILSVLKTADKQMLENMRSLLKKIDLSPQRRVVSIFLKRRGVYKGITTRVCVVNFPLYDALTDPDRKVWGVQLRVKDSEAFEALFEYLLPDLDNPETYSAPSESKSAPYFESFLDAYEKVATQLNNVINVNRKELKLVDKLKTDLWGNITDDLLTYRSEIPPLEGNKGIPLDDTNPSTQYENSSVVTTTPVSAPVLATQPVVQTSQPQPQQPVVQTGPVVATAGPVVATAEPTESISEKLARRQFQLHGGVAPLQQQQPMMGYQQPVMYQQPQQSLPQYIAPNPHQQVQQPGMMPGMMPVQLPPGFVMTQQGLMQQVQTPQGVLLVPAQQQPAMMYGQQPVQQGPVWMGNTSGGGVVASTPVMQQPGMMPGMMSAPMGIGLAR